MSKRPGAGGSIGNPWHRAAAIATVPCALLSACDPGPGGGSSMVPEVLSAEVVDGPGAIFRSLDVDLDGEGHVVVDYRPVDDIGAPTLRVASGEPSQIHRLPLVRLRAGTDYAYEVRTVGITGDTASPVTGTFSTGALPAELAALDFEVTGSATFDLLVLEVGRPSLPYVPVVVDTEGHVVWYSAFEDRGGGGLTVYQDTLLATLSGVGVQVFSPRSHEVLYSLTREAAAARTGVDPFIMHHDVIESGNGTLLVIVGDTTLARDTVWQGEAVWEWDPVTDALDRRWRSGDFLDPATDRGLRTTPDDWLHANSLAIGPRGNVLMSLFWLHEVLSIAPDWQSVEWRLGGPASTFAGVEAAMEAGQHTATEPELDRVLLFDNGRDRAEGLYSRVLEIALDREGGTAEVAWEYRPEPDVYAPIVSSVRRLDNGNTVATFGLAAGFQLPGDAPATGPVLFVEVDPDGNEVWRMEAVGGLELVYRGTPLPSLAGESVVR